ncbi:MAG: alginate export family protein [Cyclobacteriaceae bacterium]|nr:alginate export family protein [Cyclobacteriaceae bacterium HetDA_MAG_MS6]
MCLVCASKVNAQFTLSAEVRPRTEFRNGFKTLTDESKEAALFTEQRSRLYLDYKSAEFKMRVAFQDIRVWGETPQIFKEELGKAFISEAWGQYYFSPSFSLKVGRQIISYNNQRFLGGLEWAQQGRRHDAALFVYESDEAKTKLHVGFAYNQDDDVAEPGLLQSDGARFYSVGGNYKTMQYGWFHKDLASTSFSLLALNAGYQNADSTLSNKQTFGLIASQELGGIKLAGDFYYQTGELSGNSVNAFLAGVNATIKTAITPITLGFEHISGKDDDDTSTDITNFSPDFGTNHAFNGLMDYFFVGPANGNVGVTDLYVKTKFKFAGGSLIGNVHHFLTGSKQMVTGETTELDKSMGTELDLVYVRKLKGGVVWHLGYSQMLATDTMEALRGGDKSTMQNWAWTMLTFKPTLFKSE